MNNELYKFSELEQSNALEYFKSGFLNEKELLVQISCKFEIEKITLESNRSVVQQNLEVLEKQYESLKVDYKDCEEQLKAESLYISEIDKNIVFGKQSHKDTLQKYEYFKENLQPMSSGIQNLEESHARESDVFSSKKSDILQKVQCLKDDIEALSDLYTKDRSKFEEQDAAKEKELKEKKIQLENLNTPILMSKDELKFFEIDVSSNKSKLNDLFSETQTIQEMMANIDLEALEKEKYNTQQTLKNNLDTLNQNLESILNEISEKKETEATLEASLLTETNLTNTLETQDSQIEERSADLMHKKRELKITQQQLEESLATLRKELLSNIEANDCELKNVTNRKNTVVNQKEETLKNLQIIQVQKQEPKTKLQENKNLITTLREEIDIQSDELKKIEQNNNSLKSTIKNKRKLPEENEQRSSNCLKMKMDLTKLEEEISQNDETLNEIKTKGEEKKIKLKDELFLYRQQMNETDKSNRLNKKSVIRNLQTQLEHIEATFQNTQKKIETSKAQLEIVQINCTLHPSKHNKSQLSSQSKVKGVLKSPGIPTHIYKKVKFLDEKTSDE